MEKNPFDILATLDGDGGDNTNNPPLASDDDSKFRQLKDIDWAQFD
jgi:hypothetical protein